MKVLMLNGSPHLKGCTYTALTEVGRGLAERGIDHEIFYAGAGPVRDCIGCGKCSGGKCVFSDDKVNEFIEKAYDADGFVFGKPVYYAHADGRILSFLDRVFYAASSDRNGGAFRFKPGAAAASARRGGTTASLDVINKYFGISQMPVAGSTYWNMVHGNSPEEVRRDLEGMQTMRNLGRNMAWLIESIAAGKAAGLSEPAEETGNRTNFIR